LKLQTQVDNIYQYEIFITSIHSTQTHGTIDINTHYYMVLLTRDFFFIINFYYLCTVL
jgi:hypothetical protein